MMDKLNEKPICMHLVNFTMRLVLFLCCITFSFGQCPLIKKWDKRYGGSGMEWLTDFSQTPDNGFIIAGTTNSPVSGDKIHNSHGNKDFWVVKTDSAGNLQWENNYGGALSDILSAIIPLGGGGYLLGGKTNSPVSGDVSDTGYGFYDFWVIKIDSIGNKIWDQRFGGSANDELASMKSAPGGGFILAGSSYSGISGNKTEPSWGYDDYWIVKTDSSGNKIWDKRFGGDQRDILVDMQITSNGEILLAGHTASGISGDKTESSRGLQDWWIVKTDINGNKQWDKRYGGSDDDYFGSFVITPDGESLLAGFSGSPAGGDKSQPLKGLNDFWTVNIDSLGNVLWDKDFGGANNEEFLGSVKMTKDSGFIISGTSYSNAGFDKSENNMSVEQMWLLKLDANGVLEWDKTVLDSTAFDDEVAYVVQTADGGYVAANYTFAGTGGYKTDSSQGMADFWIIKFTDTTGIGLAPYVSLSVTDTNFCGKQPVDFTDLSTNNPVSWQWFFPGAQPSYSTVQNPSGIYYPSFGSFDVKLIACNAAGCDSLVLPGFINEFPDPPVPVITQNGGTYFTSSASSYAWYNSANPGQVLSIDSFFTPVVPGNYYCVVCNAFGCCVSSGVIAIAGLESELYGKGRFSIFPTISNGIFTFNTDGIYENKITIIVYNSFGQEVWKNNINELNNYATVTINMSGQSPGVYIARIEFGQISYFKNLILLH